MPLSWNEIKSRALAFSKEWQDEKSEDAEAKSFWDGFFNIFGMSRRRVATFEEPVKKLGEKYGYIDLFWKGVLVVEHKSRGKSLDSAYSQALDYFAGLNERDLPKYVIVSDFARIRLRDLEEKEEHEFDLKDLHKNVRLFGFIAGYQTHKIQEQDPVNIKAAEKMGKLHDQMKAVGYTGHPLEVYLVRLLFCLFADDTGIFERQQFQEYIEQRTAEDGSDLGHHLSTLFQVLNMPREKRLKNLDEQLNAFPYVNGKLFEEMLPAAGFDSAMRLALLDCCALDWGRISPAVFGALFQSIMDKAARRNLGAHYTSEENILKLIKPLFLDELREEFEKLKHNKNRRLEFHEKLRHLNFLDPACGCGNFLVIAYRELRLLELEILRASHTSGQGELDIHRLINLNVDQFFGIEIEEFPAQIAQVALWLMDHQMNMLVSEEFGLYFARIPLEQTATIVHGNALRLDWESVVPKNELNYILGNPPFVGKKYQNQIQKEDMILVFGKKFKGVGTLDYVSAWYKKAYVLIMNTEIQVAFVSTSSIVQGEQVPILWGPLFKENLMHFDFAYRSFVWNNDAKGKAAVHCVIIGFSNKANDSLRYIFDGEKIIKTYNITPYLTSGETVFIENRKRPISDVMRIVYGSFALDDGNFTINEDEYKSLIEEDEKCKKYLRLFIGSEELINAKKRYCVWLNGISPKEIQSCKPILKKVLAVQKWRLTSNRKETVKAAQTPTLFAEIRQPETSYLAIPITSSERRIYIPIAFLTAEVIASNHLLIIPKASLYDFGLLTSNIHMAWMRAVAGRLKSDYNYSASIVYNNFPWPENPTEKQKQAIETAAQAVLDARAQFPESSLADLYDPLTMPPVLLKAHQQLDRAVDAAYGKTNFQTEAQRVAFLFELYQKYTSLFAPEKPKRRKKG